MALQMPMKHLDGTGVDAADINVAIEVPESCPDTDGDGIPDSLDRCRRRSWMFDAVEAWRRNYRC